MSCLCGRQETYAYISDETKTLGNVQYIHNAPAKIALVIREVRTKLSSNRPVIIAIDGMAGSGKSRLARRLSDWVPGQVHTFSTDAFMRFTRQERNAFPYRLQNHADWYNIPRITSILENLLFAKDWPVLLDLKCLYSNADGNLGHRSKFEINASDVVIVEGLYGTSPEITAMADISIMMVANDGVLEKRITYRDVGERGIKPTKIIQRIKVINSQSYRQYLRSRFQDVDLLVDTSEDVSLKVLHASSKIPQIIMSTRKRRTDNRSKA